MIRTVLAAGLLLALAGVACAAPQSIGDCEKIADADAYNRCLAAFGPAMRPQKFTNVPSGATNTAQVEEPRVSSGGRGRGRHASRRDRGHGASSRHGRSRMEINVGGGGRSKSTRRRGRRH